jgi:hypothetical protein
MSTALSFPEQLNDYWQTTQDKLISEFEFRGLIGSNYLML